MNHINDYRYTIKLNRNQEKELIEEFEKMDHKMEQCFISYESIDGV